MALCICTAVYRTSDRLVMRERKKLAEQNMRWPEDCERQDCEQGQEVQDRMHPTLRTIIAQSEDVIDVDRQARIIRRRGRGRQEEIRDHDKHESQRGPEPDGPSVVA